MSRKLLYCLVLFLTLCAIGVAEVPDLLGNERGWTMAARGRRPG